MSFGIAFVIAWVIIGWITGIGSLLQHIFNNEEHYPLFAWVVVWLVVLFIYGTVWPLAMWHDIHYKIQEN